MTHHSLKITSFKPIEARNWIIFILLLSLAAFFRFVNLRNNPGWYADEGNFIDFASNLANGKWAMFGIINAPMLIQRPPLFLYVLAGLFRLFGTDIFVLRVLTATYGVLTIPVIYLFVREAFSEKLGLITVGIMTIWPWIVAYNRIGFTYNQLAFFLALTVYAGWKFSKNKNGRWAVIACIAAGISVSTDFLGAIGPLFVFGLFFLFDRRWVVPSIVISIGILFLTFLPAYLANPPFFFKDLGGVIQTRGGISVLDQLINIILNYGEFIRREPWIIIGLIGLFILPIGRARGMIWFVVGVSLLVIFRTIVPVGRSLHYTIPLFPFIALGIAAFFERAFSWVYKQLYVIGNELIDFSPLIKRWLINDYFRNKGIKIFSYTLVFLILINPLIWMFLSNVAQSVYGAYFIFAGDNNLTLSGAEDVENIDAFLRKDSRPDDLVLASTQILWSVPNRKAELSAALYYEGENEKDLYAIGKERFAYSESLNSAAYVILDPLAKEFSIRLNSGLEDLIEKVEKWPMVYKSGDIEVYKNPHVIPDAP